MIEIQAVLSEWWKPIIQSVIGAFLFWLILRYAPIIYGVISNKYARRSLRTRKKLLMYQITKYSALNSDGSDRSFYISALGYACLRQVVKGLLWLTLGLVTMSIMPIFGIVGFLGALNFFIRAANITAPIQLDVDIKEKLEELNNELEEVTQTLKQNG